MLVLLETFLVCFEMVVLVVELVLVLLLVRSDIRVRSVSMVRILGPLIRLPYAVGVYIFRIL